MIELKVNPRNPGEVFASWGIWEIVELISPSSSGCFQGEKFVVDTSLTPQQLQNIITTGLEVEVIEKKEYFRDTILLKKQNEKFREWKNWAPIRVKVAGQSIVLDWWLYSSRKMWAGQIQSSSAKNFLEEAINLLKNHGFKMGLFEEPYLIEKRTGLGSFGFDARARWSRRDDGVSLDDLGELGMKQLLSPFVEFFSLVGLQTFRPAMEEKEKYLEYWLWESPIPITVARAVALGSPIGGVTRWRAEFEKIGLGRKYLNFAMKVV